MSRETLLLRCLAGVFAVQFTIYAVGAGACVYIGITERRAVCAEFDENLQRTFDSAQATILALLGGAAMGGGQR